MRRQTQDMIVLAEGCFITALYFVNAKESEGMNSEMQWSKENAYICISFSIEGYKKCESQ